LKVPRVSGFWESGGQNKGKRAAWLFSKWSNLIFIAYLKPGDSCGSINDWQNSIMTRAKNFGTQHFSETHVCDNFGFPWMAEHLGIVRTGRLGPRTGVVFSGISTCANVGSPEKRAWGLKVPGRKDK